MNQLALVLHIFLFVFVICSVPSCEQRKRYMRQGGIDKKVNGVVYQTRHTLECCPMGTLRSKYFFISLSLKTRDGLCETLVPFCKGPWAFKVNKVT